MFRFELAAAFDDEYIGNVRTTQSRIYEILDESGYISSSTHTMYRPTNIDPKRSSMTEYSDGAMVYRSRMCARRQIHAYWFDNEDGTLDIYAHEEPSSVNPLTIVSHYKGEDRNVSLGKEFVKNDLTNSGITFQ